MDIITPISGRITKVVHFCWSWRLAIHVPFAIAFLTLCVYVAEFQIHRSDSILKWFWALPILMTLSSLVALWNPFRVLSMCSFWLVAVSVNMQSVPLGVAAIVLLILSWSGWYYFIQKPADEEMERSLQRTIAYLKRVSR